MCGESDEDVESESLRRIRHKAGTYSTPLDAYRVLVVAADEKLIALTRLSLAKNGLEVKAATTAYGGLAALDASAQDLVILDTVAGHFRVGGPPPDPRLERSACHAADQTQLGRGQGTWPRPRGR